MKNRLRFLAVIVLLFINSAVSADASTLEINMAEMLPVEELEKLDGTYIGSLIVLDMKEDDANYYFLLGDSNGFGFAVMKSDKTSFVITTIYSVFSEELLEGCRIVLMQVDDDEEIRLQLRTSSSSEPVRFCIIDKSGCITYIDCGINIIGYNGRDFAFWCEYENRKAVRVCKWVDGNVTTYDVSNPGSLVGITTLQNEIYYTVGDGNVYRLNFEEDSLIANVLEISGVKEGISLFRGNMVSAGGKLWVTAGVAGIAFDGISVGLVNVSDGIAYDMRHETIAKYIESADGSVYLLLERAFQVPPPNGRAYTRCEVNISSSSEIKYTFITSATFENIKPNYIDSAGIIWYMLNNKNGIVKTTEDQTSIRYYFSRKTGSHEISVVFDDIEIGFETEPYIVNDRVLAPIKGVAYLLGVTTDWDDISKTATIENNHVTIKLTIGQRTAIVNGLNVELDAAPEVQNEIVMIPLRFISESFSAQVDWVDTSRTAIIYT